MMVLERGAEQQVRDDPGHRDSEQNGCGGAPGRVGHEVGRDQDRADRDGGERDEGQDARAITAVIDELNREVAQRVSPAQLVAADAVLRAALFDDSTRQRASRVPPPPGQPPSDGQYGG